MTDLSDDFALKVEEDDRPPLCCPRGCGREQESLFFASLEPRSGCPACVRERADCKGELYCEHCQGAFLMRDGSPEHADVAAQAIDALRSATKKCRELGQHDWEDDEEECCLCRRCGIEKMPREEDALDMVLEHCQQGDHMDTVAEEHRQLVAENKRLAQENSLLISENHALLTKKRKAPPESGTDIAAATNKMPKTSTSP